MLIKIKLGKKCSLFPEKNEEMKWSVRYTTAPGRPLHPFEISRVECGEITAVLCQEKISSEMLTSHIPSGICATQRQHCVHWGPGDRCKQSRNKKYLVNNDLELKNGVYPIFSLHGHERQISLSSSLVFFSSPYYYHRDISNLN